MTTMHICRDKTTILQCTRFLKVSFSTGILLVKWKIYHLSNRCVASFSHSILVLCGSFMFQL